MDSAVLEKPETAGTPRLNKALAAAQAEMTNAALNKVNPHFKSKYADLAEIRDTALPVLTAHGLSVTQTPQFVGERFVLVTTLRHESGEEVSSEWPLPSNIEPQKMGSALTYARRYGLSAIVCISAEEDDDGNAANDQHKAAKTSNAKPTKAPPKMTAPVANAPSPAAPSSDADDDEWIRWIGKVKREATAAKTVADLDALCIHHNDTLNQLLRVSQKGHAGLMKHIQDQRQHKAVDAGMEMAP